MEHLSTFGLTRDPFASDPQPDAAFDAAAARDTLRRLERAAMQGKGLCLLTADRGKVIAEIFDSLSFSEINQKRINGNTGAGEHRRALEDIGIGVINLGSFHGLRAFVVM